MKRNHYFSFVLVLFMLVSLFSCKSHKSFTLNKEDISSIYIARDFIEGDVPLTLNSEETTRFVQSFNKMNLKKVENYILDLQDIVDGGGYIYYLSFPDRETVSLGQRNKPKLFIPMGVSVEEKENKHIYSYVYLASNDESYDAFMELTRSLLE